MLNLKKLNSGLFPSRGKIAIFVAVLLFAAHERASAQPELALSESLTGFSVTFRSSVGDVLFADLSRLGETAKLSVSNAEGELIAESSVNRDLITVAISGATISVYTDEGLGRERDHILPTPPEREDLAEFIRSAESVPLKELMMSLIKHRRSIGNHY